RAIQETEETSATVRKEARGDWKDPLARWTGRNRRVDTETSHYPEDSPLYRACPQEREKTLRIVLKEARGDGRIPLARWTGRNRRVYTEIQLSGGPPSLQERATQDREELCDVRKEARGDWKEPLARWTGRNQGWTLRFPLIRRHTPLSRFFVLELATQEREETLRSTKESRVCDGKDPLASLALEETEWVDTENSMRVGCWRVRVSAVADVHCPAPLEAVSQSKRAPRRGRIKRCECVLKEARGEWKEPLARGTGKKPKGGPLKIRLSEPTPSLQMRWVVLEMRSGRCLSCSRPLHLKRFFNRLRVPAVAECSLSAPLEASLQSKRATQEREENSANVLKEARGDWKDPLARWTGRNRRVDTENSAYPEALLLYRMR
ncbi:hypothetical protein HNY73_015649, partial [Argiope bruennichi]